MNSGFQSPGFQILQAKVSRTLESGLPHLVQAAGPVQSVERLTAEQEVTGSIPGT